MHTAIAQLAYRASTDSDFQSRLLAAPEATLAACGMSAKDQHSPGSNWSALLTLVMQSTKNAPVGATASKEGWFGEESPTGGGVVSAALASAP
jgi:hypothetical protein